MVASAVVDGVRRQGWLYRGIRFRLQRAFSGFRRQRRYRGTLCGVVSAHDRLRASSNEAGGSLTPRVSPPDEARALRSLVLPTLQGSGHDVGGDPRPVPRRALSGRRSRLGLHHHYQLEPIAAEFLRKYNGAFVFGTCACLSKGEVES